MAVRRRAGFSTPPSDHGVAAIDDLGRVPPDHSLEALPA